MPNDVPLLGNGNIKKISLLGSTGSIGTQTLDIAEEHPDKFEIVALSAGRNLDVMAEQIKKFKPKMVSISDGGDVEKLKGMIKDMDGPQPEILFGPDGMVEVARHPDVDSTVTGIVGCAGLPPPSPPSKPVRTSVSPTRRPSSPAVPPSCPSR